jgi:hypothetical protein
VKAGYIPEFCFHAGFLLSLFFSALKMEAIFSSETPVDFQRTTRRYIPEDGTQIITCSLDFALMQSFQRRQEKLWTSADPPHILSFTPNRVHFLYLLRIPASYPLSNTQLPEVEMDTAREHSERISLCFPGPLSSLVKGLNEEESNWRCLHARNVLRMACFLLQDCRKAGRSYIYSNNKSHGIFCSTVTRVVNL